MNLWRRQPEPLSEAEIEESLYGRGEGGPSEPHARQILETAPQTEPSELIRLRSDEALAYELDALAPDSRRLVLSR